VSHVASVEALIKDLDILKEVGEKLGFEFMEGQKTHRWYGKFLDDWSSDRAAVRKGVDPATFGKCDHALRIKARPGGYEVGITATGDGAYRLVYDNFGGDGQAIEKIAGADLLWLRNEVQAEVAERSLRRSGYRVQREQITPEHIRLKASR
jgi:hypothetical protein